MERLETRELVRQMKPVAIEETQLKPRHVREHEDAFWHQVVDELLDNKLDPIENVANLKVDLLNLRNTAVRMPHCISSLFPPPSSHV